MSPAAGRLAAGDRIGPYLLEAEAGHGGMGQVFRARDSRLGRVVAIKVIRAEFASDEDFRRRFEREARAISTLNHPHVCALYDVVEHDGAACLVMEYVEGEALDRVIASRTLSTDEVRSLARDLASALAAAHARGIIHRDLKPANIMVTAFGAKVLDFGLAKDTTPFEPNAATQLAEAGLTGGRQIIGTLAYMAPEQVAGRHVDGRSDIFAAGVILYEMLTGRRPFGGASDVELMAAVLQSTPEPISDRRRAVPPDLIAIVDRALRKSPAERYASGADLLKALSKAQPAPRFTIGGRWLAAWAAGLVLAGAAYGGWHWYQTTARAAWVNDVALPEIARLIQDDRGLEALRLYKQAERYAPNSREVIKISEGVVARPVEFTSSPPGATIYVSDYAAAPGDDLSAWERLGTAPLTVAEIPTWGYYRVRAVLPGYLTTDAVFGGTNAVSVVLAPAENAPAGMVWIPPMSAASGPLALPGFWLGRYEVTNAQFKRFIDAGGYQNETYWKEPIVKAGRVVPWREAVADFRDATGRPGPATWELSAHPAGDDNLPVTGVSWYEAAAYAEFVGESLPTLHEWRRAAGIGVNANIVLLSNFGAKGPAAAGSRFAMSPFGSFDMAGNVREWTASSQSTERYALGGGWDELPYTFSDRSSREPLARESSLGFRTIKRVEPPPAGIFAPVPRVHASLPEPVGETEYRLYERLHRYGSLPLESRVERDVDSSPHWRRETVSFRAAYGEAGERVVAHLFLPRHGAPPYQPVIVIGGATIVNVLKRVEDFDYPFEFIVRSGRAVVIPALSGTLERGPSPASLPPNQSRERLLRWTADVGRTLEYLDTRGDVDASRTGLYGVSLGGTMAVPLLALYPRIKAGVLSSGGVQVSMPPEVNAWSFAPRVRAPVLMLNGRFDTGFPLETNQKPLFRALGTPNADKRHVVFDGGHRNLVTRPDLIGEILDWFDRYLGGT